MDLPQILSIAQFDPGPPGPTYTQILHETLGPAATPDDGFDAAMADLAAVSNAFAAEVQNSPLIVDPGAIGGALGAIDPVNLDAHMAGYVGAMDAGNAIVAAHASLGGPPEILELPMSSSFGFGPGGPPAQVSHDLGTVKAGTPAFNVVLGSFSISKNLHTGILDAMLATGNRDIFSITVAYTTDTDIAQRGRYELVINPSIAGQWIGQVNTFWLSQGVDTIVTFTLNVTP